MRTQFTTILAAGYAIGGTALLSLPATAFADDAPLAESAALTYAADTRPSPRAVKTAAELGEITGGTFKVAWCAGETVTVTAPDGTATTLVSDTTAPGTATLALGAGGVWTVTNSKHGDAEFTVRYSLYGSAGSGTEADPLKVVDAEEIAEIDGTSLTSGVHIALRGADGLDLAPLALGSGLSLTELGDGVWRIDATVNGLVATSASATYLADTRPSPRAVKTAAEQAELANGTWTVMRRDGETVTLTSPSGNSSALTGSALNLNAGGMWTVTNSKQGSATFTVRRSLDGTLGDGTAASPAKLVDGDELRDYGADENYTFTLDGVDGLLARLVLPAGCRMEEAGEGVWKIVASADGRQYAWAEIVYTADSTQPGPDRKLTKREVPPVAYSGDDWKGDLTKASTITFTPPEGSGLEATTWNKTGTGAQSFTFNAKGVWTITLTFADNTTRTAQINIQTAGFVLVVK